MKCKDCDNFTFGKCKDDKCYGGCEIDSKNRTVHMEQECILENNQYDKEQIYDEKIYPLMKQIIDICKENDIQMLFSCYLKTDDNGDLNCTTYLESKQQNNESIQDAIKVIRLGYVAQKPYFAAVTVTSEK